MKSTLVTLPGAVPQTPWKVLSHLGLQVLAHHSLQNMIFWSRNTRVYVVEIAAKDSEA